MNRRIMLAGNADLERRALAYSRNPLLPELVRALIKDLWDAYNDTRWVMELLWERLEDPHGNSR